KRRLKRGLHRRDGARNLARYEGLTAARALVVEKDPVTRTKAVTFAIIHRCPIGENLRHTIWTARPERRLLRLRHLQHLAEHFAARSLIKTGTDAGLANRFQDSNRAEASDIRGVFRNVEADPHMALRREMV